MPTSTGHRGSSDHRLALRHQWRCRQAKASAHKTLSLVHRHRLSRSPGRNPLRRGPPLPPHKVSLPLHTKTEGHTTDHKLLATARLLSRELSQELIPITSTKHS